MAQENREVRGGCLEAPAEEERGEGREWGVAQAVCRGDGGCWGVASERKGADAALRRGMTSGSR